MLTLTCTHKTHTQFCTILPLHIFIIHVILVALKRVVLHPAFWTTPLCSSHWSKLGCIFSSTVPFHSSHWSTLSCSPFSTVPFYCSPVLQDRLYPLFHSHTCEQTHSMQKNHILCYFGINLGLILSTMKMEDACMSKVSVSTYNITLCQKPGKSSLNVITLFSSGTFRTSEMWCCLVGPVHSYNYSPNTMSDFRRLEFSATPLWLSQISLLSSGLSLSPENCKWC